MKKLLVLSLMVVVTVSLISAAVEAKTLEEIKKAGKIVIGGEKGIIRPGASSMPRENSRVGKLTFVINLQNTSSKIQVKWNTSP